MELGIEFTLAEGVDHPAPLALLLGCWRIPRAAMGLSYGGALMP
jgi:hypothetical protein